MKAIIAIIVLACVGCAAPQVKHEPQPEGYECPVICSPEELAEG